MSGGINEWGVDKTGNEQLREWFAGLLEWPPFYNNPNTHSTSLKLI
jgi:hypothetical protein